MGVKFLIADIFDIAGQTKTHPFARIKLTILTVAGVSTLAAEEEKKGSDGNFVGRLCGGLRLALGCIRRGTGVGHEQR